MSLATRWRQWWARLSGRAAAADAAAARPVAHVARPQDRVASASAEPEALGLAPDAGPPDKVRAAGRKHTGEGGFDPYSSDAGYDKPHGWERVDRD